MDRQETAEFLAEKVLGWELKQIEGHEGPFWMEGEEIRFVPYTPDSKLENFIYSPEGFFTVINKFSKWLELRDKHTIRKFIEAWGDFLFEQDYQAFYNSVIEVMKDET